MKNIIRKLIFKNGKFSIIRILLLAFVMCLCFDLTIVFSNVMAIKRYLRNNYGEVSKKMIVIPGFTKGVITNTILFLGINALTLVSGPIPDFSGLAVNINPYSFDIDGIYYIKSSFTKRLFKIFINNKTKELSEDKKCNFYEVLSTDEKFQHLYSEWVKKQIGCEDKNVELKFANYNTNEKLNIDFVNIKNISTNYDEIFKNLYNYYLIEIHRKNIKDLSNINYKQYADEINNKYFKKIENITGKSKIEHYVELYNNNVNLLDINYHTFGKTDYSKIDMHYEVEYE